MSRARSFAGRFGGHCLGQPIADLPIRAVSGRGPDLGAVDVYGLARLSAQPVQASRLNGPVPERSIVEVP